ncbi:MAG: hypothetical protein HLUCCA13_03110 [Halomonas sp. HL-48]|nr:hypothetical protein [Halomonas sp. HL-48]KPQ26071.1 MAG: hypothetical protein HLUCCA13_03110 [Halomonas sp. HL-48]
MTTIQKPHEKSVNASNYDSVFIWWYQPWMATSSSAVKAQYIWFDMLNDTMRHELEFFAAMAESSRTLTSCMLGHEGLNTPSLLASCYQKVTSDMTKATVKRMQKVSELNDELKERIWCEI